MTTAEKLKRLVMDKHGYPTTFGWVVVFSLLAIFLIAYEAYYCCSCM